MACYLHPAVSVRGATPVYKENRPVREDYTRLREGGKTMEEQVTRTERTTTETTQTEPPSDQSVNVNVAPSDAAGDVVSVNVPPATTTTTSTTTTGTKSVNVNDG
jgi:hypothetical protein